MKYYELALLGPLSLDYNVEPDGETAHEIGGAITYSPYSAVASGALAIVYAKAEQKEVDIVQHFHDLDATLVPLHSAKTCSIRNVYSDATHETRQSYIISQADAFKIEELGDNRAEIYHLGGLVYGDFSSDFIVSLAKQGRLAVDAQCLLRHTNLHTGDMYFEDWAEKKEILPLIEFFKVDAKEAEILTGQTDRKEAAKLLHQWGAKEVFVSYHSEMMVFDGRKFYTCAYQVDSTEGRTGRGDTVFASYISRRLVDDIEESLLFATALISLKIARRGPFRGSVVDVRNKIAKDSMHVVCEVSDNA